MPVSANVRREAKCAKCGEMFQTSYQGKFPTCFKCMSHESKTATAGVSCVAHKIPTPQADVKCQLCSKNIPYKDREIMRKFTICQVCKSNITRMLGKIPAGVHDNHHILLKVRCEQFDIKPYRGDGSPAPEPEYILNKKHPKKNVYFYVPKGYFVADDFEIGGDTSNSIDVTHPKIAILFGDPTCVPVDATIVMNPVSYLE
jgi:hypothetical protein